MTPYDLVAQENARLRQRVADLEDDVRALERQLHGEQDEQAQAIIQQRLHLYPGQAAVLFALYQAYPRPMTTVALHDCMPHPIIGEEAPPNSGVRVMVCRFRKHHGRDLIASITGHGYILTEAGHALLHRVLAFQALHAAA